MKSILTIVVCSLLATAACGRKTDPSRENFTRGMTAYLDRRGDFCLGKSAWPIDVTRGEFAAGGRNARQMPVLEKLGLVTSSEAIAEFPTEDGVVARDVRRYQLTDAGRRYYVARDTPINPSHGNGARGDFCAGKLRLAKIVGWDKLESEHDRTHTAVTYTYTIDAPAWTSDPEISSVFPVLAGIIHGAGIVELKEGFTLTPDGWIADELSNERDFPTEPDGEPLVRSP